MRLLCCTFPFAISFSAAQTPKDTAWNAYNAAKQNRRDLIPTLAALVEAYSAVSLDSRNVPPETAAIEAVADALIQLRAKLPAETVMHLYPQLPGQTLILLSRATDNTAALLQIFQTTKERDLWLAAANLLSLTESFVESGMISVQDSRELHLSCRIQIRDCRPTPHSVLPEVEGRWCAIAPQPE